MDRIVRVMDEMNLKTCIDLTGGSDEQAVQVVSEFGCGRRGHGLTDFDLRPMGPQWGWPHFEHGPPA